MSDQQSFQPGPDPGSAAGETPPAIVPADPPSGETIAEEYIRTEVSKARASLQRTQIGGLLLLVVLGGVLIYITAGFVQSLQPHAAAEIADGMIAQQVSDKGPDIATQLKEKIPQLIAQTPDYVLREMPGYREALEDRVEAELTRYGQATTQQLGQHLDAYLEAHKDQIKGMMAASNDPEALQEIGPSLKQELLSYIREKPRSGESIMDQINASLASLEEISKKTRRLAAAKGLTPEEKKARRAIAVLTQAIDTKREQLVAAP